MVKLIIFPTLISTAVIDKEKKALWILIFITLFLIDNIIKIKIEEFKQSDIKLKQFDTMIQLIIFFTLIMAAVIDKKERVLWITIFVVLFVVYSIRVAKAEKLRKAKENIFDDSLELKTENDNINPIRFSSISEAYNEKYKAPDINMLSKETRKILTNNPDKSSELKNLFLDFNIDVDVVNIKKSNAFTRYELKIENGVKLAKIRSLQENIALTLGHSNIRIFTIEEEGLIAIETPNTQRETVTLREVLESQKDNNMAIPVVLGKVVGNGNLVFDLAKAPHLLIAGSTGSGKSVCLNSIILSLVYRFSPSDLKFIFIDKKRVELSLFNGLPHLATETLTTDDEALFGLSSLTTEMKRRYSLLEKIKVRNIESYNKKAKEENKKTLPFIILIIDELYNLFTSENKKEIENSLTELASMSRAVGIHIIAATQRPSADVITGVIKMNIPARIAFKVPSKINSRIILDEGGAEELIGSGDGLFKINSEKVIRFQSAFVSEEEVLGVVEGFVSQEKNKLNIRN